MTGVVGLNSGRDTKQESVSPYTGSVKGSTSFRQFLERRDLVYVTPGLPVPVGDTDPDGPPTRGGASTRPTSSYDLDSKTPTLSPSHRHPTRDQERLSVETPGKALSELLQSR